MIDFGLENNAKYLIATDTSGGISETFFERMKTMIEENLKSISGYKARIVNFDHNVYPVATITEENVNDYKAIHTGEGRGGTDISNVVKNLKDDEELVILTDGYMAGLETLKNIKDRVTIILINDLDKMQTYLSDMGFKNVIVVK